MYCTPSTKKLSTALVLIFIGTDELSTQMNTTWEEEQVSKALEDCEAVAIRILSSRYKMNIGDPKLKHLLWLLIRTIVPIHYTESQCDIFIENDQFLLSGTMINCMEICGESQGSKLTVASSKFAS